MAGTHVLNGVEWLAACLSPGDVAPHPNFPVERPTQVELLALLAQVKFRDLAYYQQQLEESGEAESRPDGAEQSGSDIDIIQSARLSLEALSRSEGARQLGQLVDRVAVLPGMRVAAALLSAVAWAELDRLDESTSVLSRAIEMSPPPDSKSLVLLHVALEQQIAVRYFQRGDRSLATVHATAALEVSSSLPSGIFDPFPTSRGIDITSSQSQSDMLRLLRANAAALLATLEGAGGTRWQDVVRSPIPPSEARSMRDLVSGTSAYVAQAYSSAVEPNSASRTYRTEDAVLRPAYSAQLNAELTGNLGALRSRGELLAQLNFLRAKDEEPIQRRQMLHEAVRLLRYADSYKNLKSILRHLRSDGPLTVLRVAAQAVLSRVEVLATVSRCDLLILSQAADLLSAEESVAALRVAIRFAHSSVEKKQGDGGLVPWAAIQESLDGISALVAGTLDNAAAVAEALSLTQLAVRIDGANEVFKNALDRLVSAVDWSRVPSGLREDWVDEISELIREHPVGRFPALDQLVGRSPGGGSNGSEPVRGLAFAVWLVSSDTAQFKIDRAVVSEASDACVDAMNLIRQQAAESTYSHGAYSAAEVAVAMIDRFGLTDLWSSVISLLVDPRVAKHDKLPALVRMAERHLPLPDGELFRLRENWNSVTAGMDDLFTAGQDIPLESAALRVGLFYGIVSMLAVQILALRVAGSQNANERIAAVRLAAECASNEWATVLLLQLSHDVVSSVAASAAEVLARIGGMAAELRGLVADRVESALAGDGTLLPLLALRGLRDSLESVDGALLAEIAISSQVLTLADNHLSVLVRRAARGLLGSWNGSSVD
jgi:hypothetical protein